MTLAVESPADLPIMPMRAGQAPWVEPANPFTPWQDVDVEQSFVRRFEQQVCLYPDRLALRSQSRELTYDGLNRAANRLAHSIVDTYGVREEPVVILLEHDLPIIMAILAALKAGKMYVPLEPGIPPARLGPMLVDTEARLVITNNRNASLAFSIVPHSCQILNLDTAALSAADDNLDIDLGPDALLNIMYTSGSTGGPKGVLQTHRNLLHEIRITTNLMHICSEDRLALLSSCSFGASAAHIGAALLNGAALLLFSLKNEGIPALVEWLRREEISMFHVVPTVFRHMLAQLRPTDRFPHLRLVKLGGEPVLHQDVMLYKRYFSDDCLLRVALGTTEAYVATWNMLGKASEVGEGVVPVGFAPYGKKVLLLDGDGLPVAPGEAGEIVLKSRYISPGYWKQPEQSARTFVRSDDGSGELLYRTGDLGRFLPDGNLQHLGRKDSQVKIRGQRVETGEIEARLLEMRDVREAVVEAKRDHSGETRLVAYVVPGGEAKLSGAILRNTLSALLPDYMIPSAFMMMQEMPLLPVGKVNRQALPMPDWGRPAVEQEYEAPRTPLEETLAQIWVEALGVSRIGIHDNFLELGGNSLSAAQISARVGAAYQIDLVSSALFDAPTVATLALLVTEHLAAQAPDDELTRLVAELEALSDHEAQDRLRSH